METRGEGLDGPYVREAKRGVPAMDGKANAAVFCRRAIQLVPGQRQSGAQRGDALLGLALS